MNIRHFHPYILIAAALTLMTSCSGYLKEYSQDSDYVRSWEDLNELLIGSCYEPTFSANTVALVSDPEYFIHFLGDELDEYPESYNSYSMGYDGKERVFGYYTWQARSSQNDTYTGYNTSTESECWTNLYKMINVANNVIYSAKDLSDKTEDERRGKEKVDGEARFLRAYYYFQLVNLYGKAYDPSTAATDPGVPIKTSAEVEDKVFQRNTVQEVYDLILSDLETADRELTAYGAQPTHYRADSVAVHLLRSRVYLYMQNWQQAAVYAQKVINEHPGIINLNTQSDGQGVISTTSGELIFSMGSNSVMCYTLNTYKSFTISPTVYNLFSDNDLRKTKYMWTNGSFHGYTKCNVGTPDQTVDPDDASYYFYYYEYPNERVWNEVSDKNFFRSSEAYLNLAEAEAYMGNEAAAREAVNHLRRYRYKEGTDYQLTSSGQQLIREIRNERERELFLEGHRWFDLRRYAVCTVAPQTTTITHNYYYYESRSSTTKTAHHIFTLTPDDWGWTLPIPQPVLNQNTGMENNPRGTRTYTVGDL